MLPARELYVNCNRPVGCNLLVINRRYARRPPSATPDGVGTAALRLRRGDCAICGWRIGTIGDFARCGGRPEALPLDSAILGCPPPVGKSGRRGIFRQSKVWVRSHTGCMARNRTAAMAEKARRAPQTHGWRVALSEKNRVKLLTFFLFLTMARMGTAFTTAAAAPTGAADQYKEQPAHHQSHQEPVQPRHRTNPTI